ncbi:pyruvate dehydrogenase E2 component (dihydrolipoamide acetyltransferase) [Angomonas deanei]|uniref:Biotin-requiring enzyme, putative n=1 Tax=Angomonas deanei TaxID=59799 RepID=A0A7G2C5L9_9TRYP|nr:pyruvate dehydrogenase E2 component (dihydrolipoamide acetyltransferase) [Angomonas deanei]CAD2214421.1 Biotin-requiring enzyme, putative [Angomonas deanei]|eukprot:EPY40944.1 pyruvate dehydrogenase E2 component (dihydrolipoamide acetyltransferase) [Angomonas deanei]
MFRARLFPTLVSVSSFRALTITPIPMPALSPTMEKGKITEWSRKPGDEIKTGDTFCKVETDKAVVSYDNATEEGFFARVIVDVGEEVEVGTTVCLLVDEADGVNSDEVKNWKPDADESPAEEPAAAPTPAPAAPRRPHPAPPLLRRETVSSLPLCQEDCQGEGRVAQRYQGYRRRCRQNHFQGCRGGGCVRWC